MSFKGAVDLCLVISLLSLTSTIIGREIPIKNDLQTKIIQAGYDADNDFDCVNIYKQPAFSHHLLKNHKIQMRPSFIKELGRNEVNSLNMDHIGLEGEGCPPGKVPIQRNKANTSLHQLNLKYPHQHFAILRFDSRGIHGARAQISVYNPLVVDSQKSAAYIWVQNEDLSNSSNLNDIHVGWAVNPSLYGDTVTRLTAYWTIDNYQKTGCYNYQCPGFVQLHNHFHLGQSVGKTSTYGGDQYGMDLMIKQDQSTGHWWLLLNGTVGVGYWPKQIFSLMQEGANFLQYGGWVLASPNGNSPPMGSGHLPDNIYNKSCFFRNITYVDSSFQESKLYFLQIEWYVDTKYSCYNIQDFGDQGYNGQTFSFGGPGGQCGT